MSQLPLIAAAFLDRDGTLIEDANYPSDPEQVKWLAGAVQGLQQISQKGYRLFVVSNQSGVGRGLISYDNFLNVHWRFDEMVRQAGLWIEEYFYCLDKPDAHSAYRKPATGMIPKVWRGQPIDFSRSFVAGDRLSDLELGQNLDLCANFLVRTGLGAKTERQLAPPHTPTHRVVDDILEMATLLPRVTG